MQTLFLADSFLNNFLANLLATLLGIVFGIPIALWIERRRQRTSEDKLKKEQHERMIKILELIKKELQENFDISDHFHKEVEHYYNPLKDELWKAFSDGGELQWINNPNLLDVITAAYFEIHQMSFLYEKYIDDYFFLEKSGNIQKAKPLLDIFLIRVRNNRNKIKEAVDEINKNLE